MPLPLDLSADAPWKRRFQATSLYFADVAPMRPQRAYAMGIFETSVCQLYAALLPDGTLERRTSLPDGVTNAWISSHGEEFLILRDQQGDEMGHLWSIPFEGDELRDLTPEMKTYTLRGMGFSHDGGTMAFMAVNDDGFQLMTASREANGQWGAARLVTRSEREVWEAFLSQDGGLVAAKSTARANGVRQYSLVVFDTRDGSPVAELWDGPGTSVEPFGFGPLPGDTRLLATETSSGYRRPLVWDVRSGERTPFELPGLEGEILPLDWSPDGRRALLAQVYRTSQKLYVYDLDARRATPIEHPPGTWFVPEFTSITWADDGQIYAMWENSTTPPALVALDPDSGALRKLLGAVDMPAGQPWRSVDFPSSDGTLIQAWLAVPEGTGPFPVILDVHGGPHFAMSDFFNASSQAWLDHGFAWLTVNYRGSSGFGQAFKEQIWGDIGHWELEDMVAARDWLVREGIALPEAILLHGGSYGGFLTLWGLARRPELWAAGLALVAIADWSVNYEDQIEALRAADHCWFRGTPEEKPEQYRFSSPITHAEHVRAPLLIIQGENDSRTTPRQLRMYEQKMRDLGKQIEVIWFDQGHGSPDAQQQIEFQEHLLRFAYRVLEPETHKA
ncbi:MAG: prolyl oligopeptidase family serine peptidase [Roseiflexaceae bacterium]